MNKEYENKNININIVFEKTQNINIVFENTQKKTIDKCFNVLDT